MELMNLQTLLLSQINLGIQPKTLKVSIPLPCPKTAVKRAESEVVVALAVTDLVELDNAAA